ncbi:UbiH/UbiF family hydroxylase [Allomesorhizobium camelthorni]|uniref:UbiH/UbiF family hydroxylase n=1 Tax=Allomesorhizobium camelthorni TaxID=475069 RepID=A0A6G4W7L6_9HYPH|nr:UbiH/UbiF family hydroxylase [Mesorhizobium camelthorni]NGO50233.1 UbiH/UbiF family hydroxylase [Mesorhizobium camelthorni]
MDQDNPQNVIVAGTGPAGLIAALGLAHAGYPVILAGPEVGRNDGRTTALMAPALSFLDTLGVAEAIKAKAAPLRIMRIVDATNRLIRSPVVTFHASEIGEEFFGLNVPNRDLNAALERAVASHPRIEWRRILVASWAVGTDRITAVLAGGDEVSGTLAVAADGRMSHARQAAGISTSTRAYRQAALVINFAHARPHGFISTEFHTETGPFTQVPLPGDRSSLVWVVAPETAEELAALDDDALSARVEERMQSMLGRVRVKPGRQIYPLSAATPARFAQNRVALVGEAAHVFPPIGAQGLNLGIRDVEQLVAIAAENRTDPGSPAALAAYDARRRPDILARTGAVSLLNRSLLSNMLPAQLMRSAGLGVLGSFAPLRAFFMREGLRPGSGFSSIFSRE